MPLPDGKQQIDLARQATRARLREYRKAFGMSPKIAKEQDARKIIREILLNEPYYRTTVSGIAGRLSTVINSKEFRDALVGEVIHDEWVKTGEGNEEDRAYNVYGYGPPTPEQEKKLKQATDMVEKLKWCLTAVQESAAGPLFLEGAQQSAQLGTLLKESANGIRVIDALRKAASQIDRDVTGLYEPKKRNAQNIRNDELNEINTDGPRGMRENSDPDPLRINLNDRPGPGSLLGADERILGDEKPPKPKLLPEIDADLYYLDKHLKLGLDMPKLVPESVGKPADLKQVKTWGQYLDALYRSVPVEPEKRADHLARLLVASFQANRTKVDPRQKVKPFSASLAERYVKQLKEQPAFKALSRNQEAMTELMRENPNRPFKQYNALMNVIRPFGNVSKIDSDRILGVLQNMLPHMDRDAGRSSKWKELTKSIRTFNPDDPNQSGEKKLKEVFDKTCAYMKGKKSLRDDESEQNRFDQAMDVLATLGEASFYARMAAQSVMDRTNEVRRGKDPNYFPEKLKAYGSERIEQHSNKPKLQLKALDPLPKFHGRLQTVPAEMRKRAIPLNKAAASIAPLFSNEPISRETAALALATALTLSKERVYFFPDRKRDSSENQEAISKGLLYHSKNDENERKLYYGRVVVDGKDVEADSLKLMATPAMLKLAEKYTDPEARKELLRDGKLDVPEIKEGRHTKWGDVVRKNTFTKLTKAQFENLIVRESENKVKLAPKGEIHEMLRVKEPDENIGYSEHVQFDGSRIKLDVLNQAFEATKRELQSQGPQKTI